jgi:hypothetical protein
MTMRDESLGEAGGVGRVAARQQARQQCASAVLMIRPAAFEYNPQTALTNTFQQEPEDLGSPVERASGESEQLLQALESEGVAVCRVEDTMQPPKPDAVFPNNWVSFHEDGTLVLYPLQAANRRPERRPEVIDAVVERLGFKETRRVDLTHYENEGRFLEGTGSLVLDHIHRIAYASISPRTDPGLVQVWSAELGYEPVVFEAFNRNGVPLYHTNVVLSIGERAAVVGSTAIAEKDRGRVLERLRADGREVIEIGPEVLARFGANLLELASWDEALGDCRVLVMSESARYAFPPEAFARLAACTDGVLVVPVPTIEQLGGGSVRCMLAEVFLKA